MKKLFTVGILAVCSLVIANAKTYEITLSSVTKVGSVQLKAGQYTVKVTGTNAVFTQEETAKSFTTPVKVENGDKKFESTQVNATKEGSTDVVKEIELGGSKMKLEFGEF